MTLYLSTPALSDVICGSGQDKLDAQGIVLATPLEQRSWTKSDTVSALIATEIRAPFLDGESLDLTLSPCYKSSDTGRTDTASARRSRPDIATDGINLARLGLCYFWTPETLDLPRPQGSRGNDYPRRWAEPSSRARPTRFVSQPLLPPLGSCLPLFAGATGTQWRLCLMGEPKLKGSKLLTAALDYAKRGLPVFPIHSPTSDGQCDCGNPKCQGNGRAKHPRTANGHLDATTDAVQIREWWDQWPNANIGMPTGERSGVFVLDIDVDPGDPKKGKPPVDGYAELKRLLNECGSLPKTPKTRTGRGGEQRFYRYPDTPVKNSTSKIGHGLDIRGEGGYVILPPSRNLYGDYSWLRDPDARPFAKAPQWFLDLVRKESKANGSKPSTTTADDSIPDGSRNDTLHKLACSLRGRGLKEEAIFTAVQCANLELSKPEPLPEDEVRKLVQSALKHPSGSSGGQFKPNLLAREIAQQHDFLCAPIDESGHGVRLHVYSKGVFRPNGEKVARTVTHEMLGDVSTDQKIDAVVRLIKESSKMEASQLDPDALDLINVRNGMLDWRTGKLKPHSADYRSTLRINAKYRPNIKSKWVDRFLSEVFPKDALLLAEEILGILLLPETRYQKAFVFVGPGANGKSTFLNMVIEFVGPDNVAHVSLQDLADSRFRAAELLGKLANIYTDIPNSALEKSDIFKAVVVGDTITAERKFGHPFKLYPKARLLFSANELPRSHDMTPAYFRRWVVIPFPNKFEGKNAIKDIFDLLTTPRARSALLNRALAGLRRLEKQQGFTPSQSIVKAGEEYRRQCDSGYEFISEKLEASLGAKLGKDSVYRIYSSWCQENGIVNPASQAHFNKQLKEMLGVVERIDRSTPGKAPRVWKGLRLKASDVF